MGETGKPNGSNHGNATSDTLSRIARLISANDDVAQTDASGTQDAEARMDPAHTDPSPTMGEIVSDELLDALPAGLAVCLGTHLIKANASFALAFGYRDTADLEGAGSTEALFGKAAVNLEKCLKEAEVSGTNKAELKAKTCSGRMITIPVAIHPVDSGTDEPARLIVLHPRTGDDAKDVAARIALDPASLDSREPVAEPETDRPTEDDAEASAESESGNNGNSGRKKKKRKNKKKREQQRIITNDGETGTADFLAKVSHELRTPLNSIIGFAEMMKDEQLGPVGNERYRSYIRDIHDSGLYALSLVNDLLDISKIKSGEFELNFAAVDLEEVITESVQSMQPQAQRRRVLLRTSFADDLPAVLADRRSVRQIILNLVSNAIKFTLPGGQVIVSVLRTEKDGVRVRVRDTGIGMSKNEVAVAMKPYKQVDAAPKSQIGTGLGLPLTKALVEANRARFKVRSASGTGTRVDVTFPKDRVTDPRS